jgi:PmbA protein
VKALLEKARTAADQAEVYELERVEDRVVFEDGQLRDIGASRLSGTSLRLLADGRVGFAYTRNLEDPSPLVESARSSLAAGAPGDFRLPTTSGVAALETADPGAASVTNRDVVEELARLSDILRERTDAEVVLHAMRRRNHLRVANTAGTDLESEGTWSHLGAVLAFPGGASGVTRYVQTRRFAGFPEDLLEEMIALYRAGRQEARPESGRTKVLFLPSSLITFGWRLQSGTNAKSLHQGITPLADRVGDTVLSEALTVVDDPRDTAFPEARAFDDEGVPCGRLEVFSKGVFRAFHADLDYASRLGMESTGHGWRNTMWSTDPLTVRPQPSLRHLTVEPGSASFADLVASMDRGLILEDVLGAHSGNIPNGDYSVGANPAYWVEGGEIVGRAKDVMVAGNVYETLRSVVAVGDRVEACGAGRMPAILCDGVSVTCG